jgi:hypothetical protein
VKLGEASAGSENGWRKSAVSRRSRQWMVKKRPAASRLLVVDGGLRRCSPWQRTSANEGGGPEWLEDARCQVAESQGSRGGEHVVELSVAMERGNVTLSL